MIRWLALLTLFTLSGCQLINRPDIKSCEPVPMVNPPMPPPLTLSAPTFYVVSKENRESFDSKIEDGVFYAITPEGYVTLAQDMQELRRYIRELQEVVLYYKRYNENIESGKKSTDTTDNHK